MAEKRNWQEIKAAYLAGTDTLQAVAKAYGVPAGTMSARAAREKWRTQKQQTKQSPTHAQLLAPARNCVDLLLHAVEQALKEKTALQTSRQVKCKKKTDGPDGTVDQNWTEIEPTGETDIGKIKEFATVLDALIAIKRDLYDLPTGAEAERRQMAREKLKLAQQKQLPSELPQIQVLFSDEAGSWAE